MQTTDFQKGKELKQLVSFISFVKVNKIKHIPANKILTSTDEHYIFVTKHKECGKTATLAGATYNNFAVL